jgi:hypothetical protein
MQSSDPDRSSISGLTMLGSASTRSKRPRHVDDSIQESEEVVQTEHSDPIDVLLEHVVDESGDFTPSDAYSQKSHRRLSPR